MKTTVAVVIPAYKVRRHILDVLSSLPQSVDRIYVVDDACPESSGRYVEENTSDPRIQVLYNQQNQGVGGAVLHGYRQAYADGCEIAVKIDGDGQMDPALIPEIIGPIASGQADYVKGNRFYHPWHIDKMPRVRRFGNLILSFASKISSGYWDIMDPTNGYTALHLGVMPYLAHERLSRRYFFESDMLYHLSIIKAVVRDMPMLPLYADEESNLKIGQVSLEFPRRHLSRFLRRIAFNYFIRDFNLGSIHILVGLSLTLFGISFGGWRWYQTFQTGVVATSGTVMLSALPIILGFQSLIAAVQFDVSQVPRLVLHKRMATRQNLRPSLDAVHV